MQSLRNLVKYWKSSAFLCVSVLCGTQDVRGEFYSFLGTDIDKAEEYKGDMGLEDSTESGKYENFLAFVNDSEKNNFTSKQIGIVAGKENQFSGNPKDFCVGEEKQCEVLLKKYINILTDK